MSAPATVTTFPNHDEAYIHMLRANRSNHGETLVVVEGPDDDAGEWTVMTIRDAIDSDFLYETGH